MAGFTELESILDYRTLTEVYQEYGRQNAGTNPFYEFYTRGTSKNFDTDSVEFIKLGRVTDPAQVNYRGQPARRRQPTGKGRASLAMLNMFDVLNLKTDSLMFLRDPEQWMLQSGGASEIQQQLEDMATSHLFLKYLWVAKYFSGGAIYIDQNGDILEGSAADAITITTGIPAANQTQIDLTNFGGTGNAIDAAWDQSGTKILTQLDKMNDAVEYQGSEPLKHIWLHTVGKRWLRENTEILAFYTAGQERLDRAMMSETFEINGYTFHFYGGTYTAADGTVKPFIPITKAIITPEPGPWIAQGNGVQIVPKTVDLQPGEFVNFSGWDKHYGPFAYFQAEHNPPSVNCFAGDNWLYGFKNPTSVFVPTVDF